MARKIALREALREAMVEEMRRDDNVFLMGEEAPSWHPERQQLGIISMEKAVERKKHQELSWEGMLF